MTLNSTQLRHERNVIGMLGVCETTVVTEYFSTKLLHYVWRHGKDLAIEELVDMSIDAAKGLQVSVRDEPTWLLRTKFRQGSDGVLANVIGFDQGVFQSNHSEEKYVRATGVVERFRTNSHKLRLNTYFHVYRWFQALHEIAGALHIDLKPMQLLVDEEGRVKLNDFNSVHVLSRNPADGRFCPAQSSKRKRREPWPSPENFAGKVYTTVKYFARVAICSNF